MRRPGRGHGQAAKCSRGHGVPRTGTSGAKQDGPAKTKRQRKQTRRPGLEHPGRNKQQEPPAARLEHPGTSGGQKPRTDASEKEHGARAAAPQTGSSGDKRRPDATDWIIRGGSSSRSRRTTDWIIRGQRAAGRSGLEHPGRIRQQEPPHPGVDSRGARGRQMPRARTSGAEQEGAATTPRAELPGAEQPEGVPNPRAGASRGERRPEAKETGGREQGGAAKESSPEATQRTTPGKCSDEGMRTTPRRRRAAMKRTGPW